MLKFLNFLGTAYRSSQRDRKSMFFCNLDRSIMIDYDRYSYFTRLNAMRAKKIDINKRLSQAVRAIQSDPSKHHSKAELAAIAGISQRELNIAFRKTASSTPYSYLLKMRVRQAANILVAEPSLDLQLVAEKVGFSKAASLRRKFRREFGVSPEQYRAAKIGV